MESNVATLVALHALSLAARTSDQIVLMGHGSIQARGKMF